MLALTLYSKLNTNPLSRFVSSQEIMSKGEKKLHQVILTRDPKKVSPTAGKDKFLVLDSVETIKGPDWYPCGVCAL